MEGGNQRWQSRWQSMAIIFMPDHSNDGEMKGPAVEGRIFDAERELSIETPAQRALEAALFIDKPFLDFALITGKPPRPERIFGDKEWAGYLTARLFARQYRGDLTTVFMQDLHKAFATETGVSSDFRTNKGYGGAVTKIYLNNAEVSTLEGHGLTFLPQEEVIDSRTRGSIYYPPPEEGALDKLCDRYNYARKRPHDPYSLAGGLQQQCIALHPFAIDYSGRVSRMLMNWSLEMDGVSSSIIPDPERDLFSTESEWREQVTQGSSQYSEFRERINSSISPVALFGLEEKRQRYLSLADQGRITAPDLPTDGRKHMRQVYIDFLKEL